MDAATLEQDVSAELKRGNALRDNALASVLGVWGKELAAGSFGAERSSTSRARAQTNPGGGRYVCYA
jgi:hypothetical protein